MMSLDIGVMVMIEFHRPESRELKTNGKIGDDQGMSRSISIRNEELPGSFGFFMTGIQGSRANMGFRL